MALNSSFPNPDTYLNHLPPANGHEFEITRNIYLAILGASIWDALLYIPDDIKIISNDFGIVTFCFIFARVFATTYALLFVLVTTRPIPNCGAMSIAMGLTCLLAMGCTSFLFLRRLQAVYFQHRIIHWLFFGLWLSVTGMTVTVVTGVRADHIAGTGYCIMYEIKSYTAVSEFLPAVFDTLVFFAISWKLISEHSFGSGCTDWKKFFTGNLPRMSRALLRGGQQYYMLVFGMTIASGIVLYTPSIPVIYRPMLTLATTTLAASMACRVFRNLRALHLTAQISGPPGLTDLWFGGTPSQIINPMEVRQRTSVNVIDVEAQRMGVSTMTVPSASHGE